MDAVGYIASFAMGITLGILGGGGSILTVPIMVYLFSLAPAVATGYSLFVVGVTALIGSAVYIRNGDVDFRVGLAFAIPSVIGVNLSRGIILPYIPETVVLILFAVLMIAASYSMIKKSQDRKPVKADQAVRMLLTAIQGLTVGMIAGLVGAGGGFLIIPALVLLSGLPMRTAVGTSLAIIAAQSLFGFAGDILRGLPADWPLLLTVSGISVTGIIFGSSIAHKVHEQKLKTAFGWFVLAMGAAILIGESL